MARAAHDLYSVQKALSFFLLAVSARETQASISCQNLATSTLLGILTPSSPAGKALAMVRPVCLVPALASSKVPSVTMVTSKRSLCLGCVLFFSCHSEKGISSDVPMRTAATAMGSCSGGPSAMPKTFLLGY